LNANKEAYLNTCEKVFKFDWLKVMYFEKQKPTVNVIGVTIKRLKICGDITTNPKSKNCFCTTKL
jgi:hypothetical protein